MSLNMTTEAKLQHCVRSLNPLQKATVQDEGQHRRDISAKPPCKSYALSPSVPLLNDWWLAPMCVSEERVILAFRYRLGKCWTVR